MPWAAPGRGIIPVVNIYLVRHGEPSGNWRNARDPGLTARGKEQARGVADQLREMGDLRLFSSPMRRTLETADSYAELVGRPVVTEPRVTEIPSPFTDFTRRTEWLSGVMQQRYSALGSELQRWRDTVLGAVIEADADSVFFTHFIAINAIIGEAVGDDRVVHFRPDHASLSCVRLDSDGLHLLSKGREAGTLVL